MKVSRNFFHPPQLLLTTFIELLGQGGVSKEPFLFYIMVTSVILGPARAKFMYILTR